MLAIDSILASISSAAAVLLEHLVLPYLVQHEDRHFVHRLDVVSVQHPCFDDVPSLLGQTTLEQPMSIEPQTTTRQTSPSRTSQWRADRAEHTEKIMHVLP